MMTGPCLRDTEASVCATVNGGCPATNNSDTALRGVKTTDKTITLGGDPGTNYTIVLHVQGEVESKNYNGGTDQNSDGSSPTLNGWRCPAGRRPSRATRTTFTCCASPTPGRRAHDYFLNSLIAPGVENHTTYGIDYTTPAAGGRFAGARAARRFASSRPTRTAA